MGRRVGVVTLWLLATASLWAVPEDGPDDLDRLRRRFAAYRRQPDALARLRESWQTFQTLPAARRDAIIALDRAVQAESPAAQARLGAVLERYADWLGRLPAADRRAVEAAPTRAARLAVVRELRDRDWMRTQPRAVRDEWARLTGEARSGFVRRLRQEERQRQVEWLVAARFWKELETRQPLPARLTDFRDPDLTAYVNDFLRPQLTPDERERLSQAEGNWPAFPLTLVELADARPAALPGPAGPRTFAELPPLIQNRLKGKMGVGPKQLRAQEGVWPAFGGAVVEFVRARKAGPLIFPYEVWAYGPQALEPPMREFLARRLAPVLTADEKLQLSLAEGQWPAYPQTIQALARAHQLSPPWLTLPGPRERWDSYRVHRPAVD